MIFNNIFDIFGMNDALGLLFNNTEKNDYSMVKITEDNKTKYVLIIKTPGVDKKDLKIKFVESGEFPVLSVSGKTKTPFGTYSIDIGVNIYIPNIIPSEKDYVYKNGVLYFYLEPESDEDYLDDSSDFSA